MTSTALGERDWLLPQEHSFRQELQKLQPERIMPLVTSFERFARQEGLHAGQIEALRDAIRDVLSTRFDHIPPELAIRLESCTDIGQLRRWLRQAAAAPDLAAASAHVD
jgi:hypothetical protein